MNDGPGRVLVVDDDESMCDLLQSALDKHGFHVRTFTSPTGALEEASTGKYDALLTDLGMTELSGLQVCERVIGMCPNLPVIVVTAQGTMEAAVGAIRAGAYDFITKPVDTKLLQLSVARAVKHGRLQEEVKRLREVMNQGRNVALVLGESPAMRRVYDLIERVADSDASVFVYGETGTGKEVIARAIHAQSGRKNGPFVAVNCAAVPHSLLESELFGHAKGAFTDARSDRKGLFAQAMGGTLFLDEVGELPLEMQPKLLRALQERKVRPVGSNQEVPFDARLITATNRDLEHEVYEKRFREDLYYRINVVRIDLPPLRNRGNDILALGQHFLTKFRERSQRGPTALSAGAAEKLLAYDWPGNVRELENCLERAVALARYEQVLIDDLPEKIRAYRADHFVVSADDPTEVVTLDELEKRYICRVLSLVGGNKTRAADILGVDRRTLYRKLGQYEAEAKNSARPANSEPPRSSAARP
jgi:two-component system response regulator HydG